MVEIRVLTTMSELEDAARLQSIYWSGDVSALVPAHMLFSISRAGGHTLGAYDDGQLIGIQIGFLGTPLPLDSALPASSQIMYSSKRLVVLPEARGKGIGYRLKMAQRDLAIQQGISLISWTFNPLLSTNARLNIRKLGATSTRFYTDYFGVDQSDAHLNADRLYMEWWVNEQSIEDRANNQYTFVSLAEYFDKGAVVVNLADQSGELPVPTDRCLAENHDCILVEIPMQYAAIETSDPDLADRWRYHIQDLFGDKLPAFRVEDFVVDEHLGTRRAFYVLNRRKL